MLPHTCLLADRLIFLTTITTLAAISYGYAGNPLNIGTLLPVCVAIVYETRALNDLSVPLEFIVCLAVSGARYYSIVRATALVCAVRFGAAPARRAGACGLVAACLVTLL